jgi:dUTP pyrophosphatase
MSSFQKTQSNQKSTNILHNQLLQKFDKFMFLKIFISGSNNLKNIYYTAVDKHNNNLFNNKFLDAGFDLFLPENEDYELGDKVRFFGKGWKDISPVNKVDFKIKCSAQMYNDTGKIFNTGFYMYPRSSLSKSQLRLANSVGIIDSGYRGNLIGMFDVVNIEDEKLNEINGGDYFAKVNDRLVQICAPSLVPILVEIVENEYELGNESSERGNSGLGSSGN